MAQTKITSNSLSLQSVETKNIKDRSVVANKIDFNAVKSEHILNQNVGFEKFSPNVTNYFSNNDYLLTQMLPLSGGVMTGDIKFQNGFLCRRIITHIDTNNYSTTTAWAQGPVFPNITGLKAQSFLKLSMHTPMRNDSTSWGGGYIEPQISYNNGTSWISLGSSGYDGGVMSSGSSDIGSYYQQFLIYPQTTTDYTFRVRIMFASYDGTVLINQNHNINTISGTASLVSGTTSPNQHYCKIIVEEFY
jgi:hypothetical protein